MVRKYPAALIQSCDPMLVISGRGRGLKLASPYLSPEHFLASLGNSTISEEFSLGVPLERSNTSLF